MNTRRRMSPSFRLRPFPRTPPRLPLRLLPPTFLPSPQPIKRQGLAPAAPTLPDLPFLLVLLRLVPLFPLFLSFLPFLAPAPKLPRQLPRKTPHLMLLLPSPRRPRRKTWKSPSRPPERPLLAGALCSRTGPLRRRRVRTAPPLPRLILPLLRMPLLLSSLPMASHLPPTAIPLPRRCRPTTSTSWKSSSTSNPGDWSTPATCVI